MIYFITSQQNAFEDSEIELASIEDCINYFKDKSIIEVDTETESNRRVPEYLPNPYENKALSLQLGDKDNQFVIDTNNIDVSKLSPLFEDDTKIKIFCNAFFDLRYLYHWKFKVKNVYDIFLVEMLLTLGQDLPKGYKGLAQMSERYLGETVSKEVRGQINWRGLDTTVIKYAAGDVTKLNLIREKQLERVEELNLKTAVELENRFVLVLSYMSYKGFKVDPLKWRQIYKENQIKLQKFNADLDNYLITNEEKFSKYIDNTLFGKISGVKWTSSKQVIPLFKEIGINTSVRDRETGEMKDSVDGKHLTRQRNKFDILPIYLRYKEIQKELTTYGEEFLLKNINPVTGRIHSEYFQLLTTGRISSNSPRYFGAYNSDIIL